MCIRDSYKTMRDLLGGEYWTDTDKFTERDYPDDPTMLINDLDNPMAKVYKGDKFGYNYDINSIIATAWLQNMINRNHWDFNYGLKLSYTQYQRDGKMRNGLAKDNSYGKSHTAQFIDGGMKFGANVNLGRGNTFTLGLGYEHRAPQAKAAFISPEINNDFVRNLKNERVFSTEIGYQLQTSWLHANINAYYIAVF